MSFYLSVTSSSAGALVGETVHKNQIISTQTQCKVTLLKPSLRMPIVLGTFTSCKAKIIDL